MKKTESVMPVGRKRDIVEILEKLKDDIGVGHVRYSTAGSFARENAQPLVLNYVRVHRSYFSDDHRFRGAYSLIVMSPRKLIGAACRGYQRRVWKPGGTVKNKFFTGKFVLTPKFAG